jgi:hypothetical protein
VLVLNRHGKPLMPCSPATARRLLKSQKAKVVDKVIFTIKLLYGSAGHRQPIKAGMDTGSKHMASAAITGSKVLYQSEQKVRDDIHDKMEQRKMYRRNRRSRKTRYRKPRFDNRRRKEGWIAPTLLSKVNAHLREKKFMESRMPITSWNLEIAEFDIHKIINPDVSGNGYQEGNQKGFYNTKQYVYWRDGYVCQHCKGKSKDKRLHAHHIIFRRNGGPDTPDNLITMCKPCHDALHRGEFSIKLSKRLKQTKHATEMGIISAYLKKSGWVFEETYGYETKYKREQILNLPKTHYNDAIAICCEEGEVVELFPVLYLKRCVSKGDYQLTKGKRGEVNLPVHKLFGLRKFDHVQTPNGIGFVKGKRSTGYFSVEDLEGNKISDSVNVKKGCKRLSARKTTIVQRKILQIYKPISSHE